MVEQVVATAAVATTGVGGRVGVARLGAAVGRSAPAAAAHLGALEFFVGVQTVAQSGSSLRADPVASSLGVKNLFERQSSALAARSHAMELTAVLTHAEEGGFVALNPETGTTTQGETVEEAVANLKEATAVYLSAEVRGSLRPDPGIL